MEWELGQHYLEARERGFSSWILRVRVIWAGYVKWELGESAGSVKWSG